jgi:hypothetical protein
MCYLSIRPGFQGATFSALNTGRAFRKRERLIGEPSDCTNLFFRFTSIPSILCIYSRDKLTSLHIICYNETSDVSRGSSVMSEIDSIFVIVGTCFFFNCIGDLVFFECPLKGFPFHAPSRPRVTSCALCDERCAEMHM